MRIRWFVVIIASAGLIFGLGGPVLARTAASAQGAPALRLSGGKPKPCSVRKGTITDGCTIRVKGTSWPKSAAVDVVECNARILTGDANACDTANEVGLTTGRSGRFSVNSFTIELGTVGDGSCSAPGSPPKCYVQATSGGETVRTSFTGGTSSASGGSTFNLDGFNWTIIDRHGEYTQGETECNVPGAVSVASGILSITTTHQSATCGDIETPPSSWPYTTGDVQWTNFNFTYGTVTYRAKFPAQNTKTWPAVWFLGSGCQPTNIVTGETGYGTCPKIEQPGSGYEEIDATECYTGGDWCQLALAQPSSFPVCVYPVDTNWHTYSLIWTATSISMTMDGQSTGCSFKSADGYDIPQKPMFMIIQTQTGGSGGTPDNSHLPAVLQVADVTLTQ
ncbi:MAG: family 16 glycosylhydrolase [Acidimicrobiales bacterium]|nr:family 16 glycosylhydrolase [Acidimicrobiales bacterium]